MIHRSSARRLVALAVLASTALVARESRACRTTTCAAPNAPASCVRDPLTQCWRDGEPLYWEQGCVSFSVHHEGIPSLGLDYAATEALVTQAFSLWPSTSCDGGSPSITVRATEPLTCGRSEYQPSGPNANSVLFRSEDWPHDPSALGLTTVTFNTRTGRIDDADMEINLTAFDLSPGDVAYVVAHEAGHFFGLDHSADTDALMYLHYSPFGRTDAPILLPDDVSSICSAYPPSRPVAECDFEPDRGFSSECGGDVEAGCAVSRPHSPTAHWFLGLAAALALLRRVRVPAARHPFKTARKRRPR